LILYWAEGGLFDFPILISLGEGEGGERGGRYPFLFAGAAGKKKEKEKWVLAFI